MKLLIQISNIQRAMEIAQDCLPSWKVTTKANEFSQIAILSKN